ncbi:hypothetical protein ACHAWF_015902 [Thalassiosira exigua]
MPSRTGSPTPSGATRRAAKACGTPTRAFARLRATSSTPSPRTMGTIHLRRRASRRSCTTSCRRTGIASRASRIQSRSGSRRRSGSTSSAATSPGIRRRAWRPGLPLIRPRLRILPRRPARSGHTTRIPRGCASASRRSRCPRGSGRTCTRLAAGVASSTAGTWTRASHRVLPQGAQRTRRRCRMDITSTAQRRFASIDGSTPSAPTMPRRFLRPTTRAATGAGIMRRAWKRSPRRSPRGVRRRRPARRGRRRRRFVLSRTTRPGRRRTGGGTRWRSTESSIGASRTRTRCTATSPRSGRRQRIRARAGPTATAMRGSPPCGGTRGSARVAACRPLPRPRARRRRRRLPRARRGGIRGTTSGRCAQTVPSTRGVGTPNPSCRHTL